MLWLINKMLRTRIVEGKPRTERSLVVWEPTTHPEPGLRAIPFQGEVRSCYCRGDTKLGEDHSQKLHSLQGSKERPFWLLNTQNDSQNLPQKTISPYLLGKEHHWRLMSNICLLLMCVWRETTHALAHQLTPPLGNTAPKGSAQKLGQLRSK